MIRTLSAALRNLARAPVFAITVVTLLSLGFGATVAVLSIGNAIYLSALPFESSERLVAFNATWQSKNCRPKCTRGLTSREMHEQASQVASAGVIAGANSDAVRLSSNSPVTAIEAVGIVSWNLLPVLGVRPAIGRGFVKSDEDPGAELVAVISHSFWQNHFGADVAALDRTLATDRGVYRIVGVLPPSAALGPPIFVRGRPAFLVPAGTWIEQVPLEGYARLNDRATIEGLKSALAVAFARLPSSWGTESQVTWRVNAIPLRKAYANAYAGSYPLLLVLVVVVLGIVTANTAALFLARLEAQKREFAVRAALGANRFQIAAPALVQGLLIAALAGTSGVLIAVWSTHVLAVRAGAALPYWTSVGPSVPFTAVAVGLLLAMWSCFCGAPALLLARTTVVGGLVRNVATSSGTLAGRALRRWLVAGELACSFVLMSAAGLLAKTLFTAVRRDLGVETRAVEVILDTEDGRLGQLLQTAEQFITALRRFPNVKAAGAAARGRAVLASGLTREGDTEMLSAPDVPGFAEAVTLDFFRAMGTAIIEGRGFDSLDAAGSRSVVVIGDSLAQRLFPGASAVGKRVKFGGPSTPVEWLSVVGVAREARCSRLAVQCEYIPRMYMPASQGFPPGQVYIRVRTSGSPIALLKAIPALVDQMPNVRILEYGSVMARVERELAPVRTQVMVTAGFGTFASGLAAVGFYSLLAYLTSLRRRELAIRTTLGATPGNIMRSVVLASAPIVAGGLFAGGVLALGAGHAMRSILFETSPADWTVIAGAGVLLLVLTVLAAIPPVRSAQRVELVDALSAD